MPNGMNIGRTLHFGNTGFVRNYPPDNKVQGPRDVPEGSCELLFRIATPLEGDNSFSANALYLAAHEPLVSSLTDSFEIGSDQLKLQTGTSGIQDQDVHQTVLQKPPATRTAAPV